MNMPEQYYNGRSSKGVLTVQLAQPVHNLRLRLDRLDTLNALASWRPRASGCYGVALNVVASGGSANLGSLVTPDRRILYGRPASALAASVHVSCDSTYWRDCCWGGIHVRELVRGT